MKRTPLAHRVLPDYTRGEEICNMATHIVGGALGILATVLCPIVAAKHHNVYGIVGGAIFGFSMIVLYAISAVYHGLSPRLMGKKVMQVLDHCSIFFLITGTYTPIVLGPIRSDTPGWGWALFASGAAFAALPSSAALGALGAPFAASAFGAGAAALGSGAKISAMLPTWLFWVRYSKMMSSSFSSSTCMWFLGAAT